LDWIDDVGESCAAAPDRIEACKAATAISPKASQQEFLNSTQFLCMSANAARTLLLGSQGLSTLFLGRLHFSYLIK
jgi:hypothetical protein